MNTCSHTIVVKMEDPSTPYYHYQFTSKDMRVNLFALV